jgi:hypothetical protein
MAAMIYSPSELICAYHYPLVRPLVHFTPFVIELRSSTLTD